MSTNVQAWPAMATGGMLDVPDSPASGREGSSLASFSDVDSGAEDLALFVRIAAGDAEAFALFYDRHSSLFFGLACRILGDETEAEDVVQEACVRLWEKAPEYNPTLGKPVSWAVAILRNKAIDRQRSRQRQSRVVVSPDGEGREPAPPPNFLAASAGDIADTHTVLRRTVLALPNSQREVLQLAFFDGMTHHEIAQRLSIPLGTIKARIRRGLLALRDTLEGYL